MPLQPHHILKFLDNEAETKTKSELLDLLRKRIDELCFEQCQIDRIQCTLTPLCSRRFLIKLRIKSRLPIDDLPKFCYNVHKGVIERFFRNKTIIYRPYDAYLYIIEFLDVFFHGDYRKLNKFISFKKWEDVFKIFDDRIHNRNENFNYLMEENYIIFKFEDRIHIIFINENYVLCNANRENIVDLDLLYGICKLYGALYFPEVKLTYIHSRHIEITLKVPYEVLKKISAEPANKDSKADDYFWNTFWEDLNALTQYCKQINLNIDKNQNLEIVMSIGLLTNTYNEEGNKLKLRFRDLRLIFNFITRIYTDYYIIWI